ncbi:MAG: sterol desaturase family protein [Methylococcales bacterium]
MSSEIKSLMTFIQTHIIWPSIALGDLAAIILLLLFSLLMILETKFPNRNVVKASAQKSYASNAGLFVFNSIIVSFLTAASLLLVSQQYVGTGLLSYIDNSACQAVIAFLCLDLLLYLWHHACHRFECLWLFHRVHHSDAHLNVSTAFRVHILEVLITTIIKAMYLIVLGLDKTVMLLIEAIFTGFVMFHHSNIAVPGERWLGKVFITPYLHRTHHAAERQLHDSNYGAVLSLWDRLFGTLSEMEPVAIGIKTPSPQTTLGLIRFGFGYTSNPATVSLPNIEAVANLDAMIAEAAYYKAEKRAFSPGNEMSDWLEAKREILRSVYDNQHISV